MRTYRDEEKWTQPVFLVLVHSSKGSSLHPPPICYTMQGYTLLGEQVVMITANDTALSRRIADEGSDSAGEWVSEKLGIANEAAVIPVNRLIVEKTDSNGSVDRRLVFYTYLKDKEFVQYEYCVVRVSGLIPVEGNIAAIEENLKAFMGETLSLIFEDVSVEKERVISIVTGLGWHGYLALALIFVIPLGMIIYPLAARKVFVRGEEPVEDEGEEETVIPEQPFTLPFNVEEKQGDEKILAAYYNAQAILARVTGIDPKSCPTLRDFREKVLPKLTQDVAGSFTELTGTAEALMYSTRGQDGETVERAAYLSEEIIGIMNERLPESVRLHPDS